MVESQPKEPLRIEWGDGWVDHNPVECQAGRCPHCNHETSHKKRTNPKFKESK